MAIKKIMVPLGSNARNQAVLETALVELEDLGEKAEPLRELVRFSVRRTV